MITELIAVGFLLGSFIYHRWILEKPAEKKPPRVNMPRVDEGATIPLIYGKCRVRAPILAWAGYAKAVPLGDSPAAPVGDAPADSYLFACDLHYIVGIPFRNGVNYIHNVWAGDTKMFFRDNGPFIVGHNATGDGNFEPEIQVETGLVPSIGFVGGFMEFMNGNDSQTIVDPGTGAATTELGRRMKLVSPGGVVSGYRGVISALLYGEYPFSAFSPTLGPPESWYIGTSPTPPAFSFEVSSYPGAFPSDPLGPWGQIGDDANPSEVIYDLLSGTFAKLGRDTADIDTVSFSRCSHTLYNEGMGYSMAIEETQDAGDIINEALKMVDGVLVEDPYEQKIKLKLIRADYRVSDILHLDPSNAKFENYVAGNWTGLINKIRVSYCERLNDYNDGSATAVNQANAVGQNGKVEELILSFPMVTNEAQAKKIAGRELTARSRPISKIRATVDKRAMRVLTGDPIMVNYPKYNISNRVYRAAQVDHGTPTSNSIVIDLIEEHFYVLGLEPAGDVFPVFPGAGGAAAG